MLTPDIIFTVAQVVLAASLLPSLRQAVTGRTTITLWTSVPTTYMLFLMSGVLIHIDMNVSGAVTFVTACGWGFLALIRSARRS